MLFILFVLNVFLMASTCCFSILVVVWLQYIWGVYTPVLILSSNIWSVKIHIDVMSAQWLNSQPQTKFETELNCWKCIEIPLVWNFLFVSLCPAAGFVGLLQCLCKYFESLIKKKKQNIELLQLNNFFGSANALKAHETLS